MKAFLARWATTALAVLVSAPLAGIQYEGIDSLLAAALLLGAANAFLRPVLLLLSLPLIVVSFGFFILIINASLLYLVGYLVRGFDVTSFGSAFFGAIFISVVSWLVGALFKSEQPARPEVDQRARRIKRVSGKVIDI